jgi:hypothetical protein
VPGYRAVHMASMFSKLSKFARSKQGRALADHAVRAAKDPKTRRQVEAVGRKFLSSRKRPR